jgi:ABC-2 type transport system ATP-binding protein
MNASDLAIRVEGLTKSYGAIEAVRGIDLEVRRGEVFAMLGPNGAGKTTTVEILEGHRTRTSGTVAVLGHDPARHERDFKERIGIVLQTTGIEPYLSVREAVALFGGYYPHPRPVDEVLAVVGLDDQSDMRVRKLSGGQQRRLDVAIGLAGDPELLFLDEPTTGFDPGARRQAWEMIRNLRALGKTVFLTTHYMDEAEQLADRVAIIADGRIVAEGSPQALMSGALSGGQPTTAIAFRLPPRADPTELPPELDAYESEGMLCIESTEPTRALFVLTSWATDRGIELHDLTVSRPSLEDVYLALVREAGAAVEVTS